MSIQARQVKLTRFIWDLKEPAPVTAEIPAPFVLRIAGEQETEEAIAIVQAIYNLDPEWNGCAMHIKGTILPGAIKALAKEPTCLFVQHGNRVIAVSIYDTDPEEGASHLVSGPCVLSEYCNRGIGGALLGATLEALRIRGIVQVTGQTRPNSASAKYLCPKFGGKAVVEEALPTEEHHADAA